MEALPYLLYLAILLLLAVVLFKMFGRNAGVENPPKDAAACSTCSSEPGKCLQDCVIENAVGEIEYFDDEELDVFKGRRSDEYSDDEAAQFSEVMYTMKTVEVKDWLISLNLRGINLPDQLKDEAIMLMEG